MKKYFYISLAVLSVFIFNHVMFANAAEEIDVHTVQHEVEKGTTPSRTDITPADLGIQDVGTLPTSKWYFLKEWKRGVSRLFTFDATAKVELELDIMNKKAAEAIAVEKAMPNDKGAFEKAFANYADGAERLRARIDNLEENSGNPNVEKLLKRLEEQTLKHALLLNQLAERWNNDPYVEDANVVNPQATRDNHLQGAVDVMQKKIREIAVSGAEKDTNIKEKAEAQIKRAEEAVKELESVLIKFSWEALSAKHAINTKGTGAQAGKSAQMLQSNCKKDEPEPPALCGEGLRLFCVLDNAGKPKWDCVSSSRISTNLTIERQTPKRDFGDRMKAGLDTVAGILANAKAAFAEGKFGEAFGRAREAEVLARNDLRAFAQFESGFTIPASDGSGKESARKIPPPETNNVEAACPGDHGPACEAPKISECHNGKWICVGPASGVPKIPTVKEPSTCGQIRCLMYQPVCGTDGKTYSCGEADARSCGTKVAYAGECKIVTPVPPVKPIEGMACTQQYDPVCGIDGKTYSNACFAKLAGASVAFQGACNAVPIETKPATTGQTQVVPVQESGTVRTTNTY